MFIQILDRKIINQHHLSPFIETGWNNMLNRSIILTIILSLTLISSSCSTKLTSPDEKFLEVSGLSMDDDVNNSIKLELPYDNLNGFQQNEVISINMRIPNKFLPLKVAEGGSIKFFQYDSQSDSWVEIADIANKDYVGDTLIDDTFPGLDFRPCGDGGTPDPEQLGTLPATIRVFWSAELVRDGELTGKKLAAYVDVKIYP